MQDRLRGVATHLDTLAAAAASARAESASVAAGVYPATEGAPVPDGAAREATAPNDAKIGAPS